MKAESVDLGDRRDIKKKKIEVKETIKNLGRFNINIKLYEGVNAKLNVNITAE